MDASVIIVTYNSGSLIAECLSSVRQQKDIAIETIVIDNASNDNTLEVLGGITREITLIQNRENLGFGRACNLGALQSHGRYLYFLNPDAQLIGESALAKLCRAMDEHPVWGLAGTRVIAATGEVKAPAANYPDQQRVRINFSKLPGKIASVGGASMIARRQVFEQLGGFDPNFFLYGEETDLCLRARQRGHEVGYVESVEVRHIGGASERGKDPYEVWTRRANGLHQFWSKHYPADEVRRLVRRNRTRARYRMLMNGLLARFRPPGSIAWEKHRRYQAVWEVSSRFLQSK